MERNRKFIPGNIINGYRITKTYDKMNIVEAVCLKCGKVSMMTKIGISNKGIVVLDLILVIKLIH